MIEFNVPGRGVIQLEHLVCDVNGTLALDGQLIEGVGRKLNLLRDRLQVHIISADTHGRQDLIDFQLNLKAMRITPGDESRQKASFVEQLGAAHTAAIGQGANDAEMLQLAEVGVCVLSPEGAARETLFAADLIAPDIFNALELFEKPLRLVASLRK
jgi:P-type E1-E2 ATPase